VAPRIDSSTVSIEANAREAWRVLADESLGNAAWAPGVHSSGPDHATPSGINGSRHGGRLSDIQAVDAMFAQAAAASTSLETYLGSDDYGTRGTR